ncbi:hypothetical protein E2986_11213 [Frieseomelitta varia]|uniref:Uncharacterized protein n=1 Tax=Frieseomelitta varia TaxID=561572 RepID=A0A833RTJ5_9HYME|nr:hypothetical protein E2986_11213 [Frieseomelitta varia]
MCGSIWLIRSDENVEAHEPNWTASGRHEEEERSFVVQKLAWHTEALIDCLERGKNSQIYKNLDTVVSPKSLGT